MREVASRLCSSFTRLTSSSKRLPRQGIRRMNDKSNLVFTYWWGWRCAVDTVNGRWSRGNWRKSRNITRAHDEPTRFLLTCGESRQYGLHGCSTIRHLLRKWNHADTDEKVKKSDVMKRGEWTVTLLASAYPGASGFFMNIFLSRLHSYLSTDLADGFP